jgi:hypothetical protein
MIHPASKTVLVPKMILLHVSPLSNAKTTCALSVQENLGVPVLKESVMMDFAVNPPKMEIDA